MAKAGETQDRCTQYALDVVSGKITAGEYVRLEEYENMALMKSVVEENTSGIVESVTQFQKDAVIDEYTQQLIEEGLI